MILSKVGDKWEWKRGEEAKYSRAAARRNWVSFLSLLVLREALPDWFKRSQTHNAYISAEI